MGVGEVGVGEQVPNLCNLQTETFFQNPIHTFLTCVPKFMSDILCGCGMLRKQTQLFVIGWGLLRPQDEWRLSWVISVTRTKPSTNSRNQNIRNPDVWEFHP